MDQRVIGPVHGHYIASFAARMGELGQHYLGYYKICLEEPAGFLEAKALCAGDCATTLPSAEAALLEAEDAALARLADLPPGPCAPREEGPLAAILYVSTARPERFTVDDLTHLLACARARNAHYAVTGVLLAFQGRFMQYIEGPAAQLELVNRIIQTDSMHHGIVEILRGPVQEREFSDWSMAFGSPEMRDHDPRRSLPALFRGESLARTLLRQFLLRGG